MDPVLMVPIKVLPEELLVEIFSWLSHDELIEISIASSRWKRIASDPKLWQRLYIKKYGRNLNLPSLSDDVNNSKPKRKINWKAEFITQHRWMNGEFTLYSIDDSNDYKNTAIQPKKLDPTTISEDVIFSNPVVTFYEEILFSSSDSNTLYSPSKTNNPTIFIRNLNNGKRLGQLEVQFTKRPVPFISCLRVDDFNVRNNELRLACGFSDGSLSIWTVSTASNEARIYADNILNIETASYENHAPITAISVLNDIVVTISVNFMIRIIILLPPSESSSRWTYRVLERLNCVICLQPVDIYTRRLSDDTYATYICYSTKPYAGDWEVACQEIKFTKTRVTHSRHYQVAESTYDNEFRSRTSKPATCIKFRPPYLLAGTISNNIIVYTLVKDEHVADFVPEWEFENIERSRMELRYAATLYGHTSAITALSLNERGKLVTAASDGIKVWDLPTLIPVQSPSDLPSLSNIPDDDESISRKRKRSESEWDEQDDKNDYNPIAVKKSLVGPASRDQEESITIIDPLWAQEFITASNSRTVVANAHITTSMTNVRCIEFNETKIVSVHGGSEVMLREVSTQSDIEVCIENQSGRTLQFINHEDGKHATLYPGGVVHFESWIPWKSSGKTMELQHYFVWHIYDWDWKIYSTTSGRVHLMYEVDDEPSGIRQVRIIMNDSGPIMLTA
ncbi:hypothetical protein HK098_003616 [Nowakowskiella sp. JEL0407]|nr:hypothetical protein HK098_003616 [Nowakowskiella sp. JEL0407]